MVIANAENKVPKSNPQGLVDFDWFKGKFYDKHYAWTTVTLWTQPHWVVYCPTNDRMYVCNLGSDNVSVINPSTNTVVATITVWSSPRWVTYCPTNDRLYVSNVSSDNVSVINPTDNTVVETITVWDWPLWIAYCPSNNRMYVTNSLSNNIQQISFI